MVHPQEEELVLDETVEGAVGGPEYELASVDWEAALEQVACALLKGDPYQCVDWGGVASSEFKWPCSISVVSSSCILEGD